MIDEMDLEVSVAKYQLTAKVDASHCHINVSKVVGCYDCEEGAYVMIRCETDFGTAMATIECTGGIIFSTHCSTNAREERILLEMSVPAVNSKCVAACPASAVEFTLEGLLSAGDRIVEEDSFKSIARMGAVGSMAKMTLNGIGKIIGVVASSVKAAIEGLGWRLCFLIVPLVVLILVCGGCGLGPTWLLARVAGKFVMRAMIRK
jgi:ferredoxin